MKNAHKMLVICGLLGAATLTAQAQSPFPSPDSGPYSYVQNIPSYLPGVVGPREANNGVYNTFQRGQTRDFQCVYSRATSYDQNVATFHWTKPIARRNGTAVNPAATNYVIIALVGASPFGYDTDNIDYATNYINDIPTPYPAGNGTISAANEVFRRTPYACPACGPGPAPRQYYVLKTGSYVTNPNDTTATLTNAVVGQRYYIARFDYVADAAGLPTNVNPTMFPTFYQSRPIALSIPHATPTITGITTDAAGHATVTWSKAVEDPTSHGVTTTTTSTPFNTPLVYTVRINEDDSVTTAKQYLVGQAAFVNKPFAAGFQYGPPAGYKSSTSSEVPASTAPAPATYSFTFDRATDIVVRPGHYYSFQVVSNEFTYGQYLGDSKWSRAVTAGDPKEKLAVDLTEFTASRTSTGANLSWATTSEVDNLGFEVQRSTDGSTWTKVAFVAGLSGSTAPRQYAYQDTFAPTAYYRLAQVNSQLRVSTYTARQLVTALSPLAARPSTAEDLLTLYPNPTTQGLVTLTGLDPQQPVQLRNPLGQVVSVLPAGHKQLDVRSQTPGIYLVQQGARTQRLVIR